MESVKKQIDWVNTIFLIATPLFALIATPIYIYNHGIHFMEILLLVAFYWASGLGITMGYHRLFTHKTYEASPVLKFFLLVFGAMAIEHTAYKWSSDHRTHHSHVDKEIDPYNAKKGFWHSHIGWIFLKGDPNRSFDNVADLAKDKLVMWQHRNYLAIASLGWILPALIGIPFGRPFGFFLWGGLIRMILAHHSTFFVNSVAHIWGKQTYDDKVSARDSIWVALLSFGEGYHSFHHRFQADYRNGVRWYHWDPSKWLIYTFSRLGLTKNLRASPDEIIISRRLEMDLKRTKNKLSTYLPNEKWQAICQDLEQARTSLELTLKNWKASIQQYSLMKRENPRSAKEMRQQLKEEIRRQRALFIEAMRKWNEAIQYHLSAPALAMA